VVGGGGGGGFGCGGSVFFPPDLSRTRKEVELEVEGRESKNLPMRTGKSGREIFPSPHQMGSKPREGKVHDEMEGRSKAGLREINGKGYEEEPR